MLLLVPHESLRVLFVAEFVGSCSFFERYLFWRTGEGDVDDDGDDDLERDLDRDRPASGFVVLLPE